jgi:hypothetical protein
MRSRTIVVLGRMATMPVPGVIWQTAHYLHGFERLGFDVWYVEAHGSGLRDYANQSDPHGTKGGASFLAGVLAALGMGSRWALDPVHSGEVQGISRHQLDSLYGSADLIVNLHGGTIPREEHSRTGRLMYVETDPVEVQFQLATNDAEAIAYLEPHCWFFTFGERYGKPGCGLPVSSRFDFKSTRQPIVMDWWTADAPRGDSYSTIGNWRQHHSTVVAEGRRLYWSKDQQWEAFMPLPERTGASFELALSSIDQNAVDRLTARGWTVVPPFAQPGETDEYRRFVTSSRGEFTVAKEQNVVLRTGWFSDRSATYLAAGRPVLTQNTGFDTALPVGEGLLTFTDLDSAVAALEQVENDWDHHSLAARRIASEYFDSDRVLTDLLDAAGVAI